MSQSSMKKSAQRRRKHCKLAVVGEHKKNRPTADPFLVARDGKNNQLEMVTTFTLETEFGEDGYTQFRVIAVIEPQTNTQTDSGGDYNTLRHSLVYSVIITDRYRENAIKDKKMDVTLTDYLQKNKQYSDMD